VEWAAPRIPRIGEAVPVAFAEALLRPARPTLDVINLLLCDHAVRDERTPPLPRYLEWEIRRSAERRAKKLLDRATPSHARPPHTVSRT